MLSTGLFWLTFTTAAWGNDDHHCWERKSEFCVTADLVSGLLA